MHSEEGAMKKETKGSNFVVCCTMVMCALVMAVDTLPVGVKYLSLRAHTEEHVKDERDGAAACTFSCR